MFHRLLYKCFIFLIVSTLILSGCSTAARLKKADRCYANGEYYAAADIYKNTQRRIKDKKLKGEVNFRLAECYRNTNNHTRAVRSYTSAIRYKCSDTIVYLHIAKSQLVTGRYADAKANFLKYLSFFPDSYEAQSGLASAENWKSLSREFTRYKVTEAREFNYRRTSDFCPVFMGEGSDAIMFTSNRTSGKTKKTSSVTGVGKNDIYTSRMNKSGKWEPVEPIEGSVNTDDDEGVVSLSADGKTMFFTKSDAKKETTQIFQSTRSGGEWTEPILIPLFADSTISVGHPAISPDGSTLYFVSDAPEGLGGKDIWMATLDNGKWVVTENLGDKINTSGNEMFPYVRSDGALFFSSDGHVGLGGLDIYMATTDSLGAWTVANLLSPINSSADDFGITFNSTHDMGYFSSSRNQNRPIDKIYNFYLPPLVYAIEGKAIDDKGDPLAETTIRLVGDNGDNVKTRTRKDGSYRITINVNARYVMLASHRGYLNASYSFDTHGLKDSKTYSNVFKLSSISKPVKMDNIFYESGKWTLSPQSEEGLNALIKILNDNPNIAMEISAHTDMVGSDNSNIDLSQKRAQSVVTYLINAGIDPARLTPVGYGETSPVEVSDDLASRYDFLKAGDILTPEYIETLSPADQEICNSINRRTEFKVTKTTYNMY